MIVTDKMAVGPWVAKKVFGKFHPDSSEAIGLSRHGELVAGVIYESWNGASIVCHIAVEGLLTPAYLAAIFDYPFKFIGVDKIIAPVAESNADSIKFVRKLGFTEEARITRAHPDGCLLLYTMEKEQCRFIGERYGQRLTHTARAA